MVQGQLIGAIMTNVNAKILQINPQLLVPVKKMTGITGSPTSSSLNIVFAIIDYNHIVFDSENCHHAGTVVVTKYFCSSV